jgi:Ran GTPase-activating protein (RanGAP) involved in mRNA processing and transport
VSGCYFSLSVCLSLLRLTVSAVDQVGEAGPLVVPALRACQSLQTLDLGGSFFLEQEAQREAKGTSALVARELSAALRASAGLPRPSFSSAARSRMRLPEAIVVDICRALRGCRRVRFLSIANADMSSPSCVAELSTTLACLTRLRSLLLPDNHIPDAELERVCAALASCPDLESLQLPKNDLGVGAAGALGAALPKFPKLAHLDLSGNLLTSDGAQRLAVGLSGCSQLVTLRLAGTRLGDAGLSQIAAAIRSCTQLQSLHLQLNGIGFNEEQHRHGMAALMDAVRACHCLHNLNLACALPCPRRSLPAALSPPPPPRAQ